MKTLTQNEMAGIEGGNPLLGALIWFTGLVMGAGIGAIADNWSDFKKGVMEGYSGTTASN